MKKVIVEKVKIMLAWVLCKLGVDSLWRYFNRNRLLIITYHGVYDKFDRQAIPLFTHLNANLFRSHLQFLSKHYQLISLSELVGCIKEGRPWPEGAALITFDDGFRNNYDVAFSVLQEFEVPAAIFLTVGFIGTERLLWFDELFLMLCQSLPSEDTWGEVAACLGRLPTSKSVEEQYPIFSEMFKGLPNDERLERLARLRKRLPAEESSLRDNFKMLTWEQVLEMKSSGLVEFGVHTATHRIVSGLCPDELEGEVVEPKKKMEGRLNCKVETFCYPNGIPDVDFLSQHEEFLMENGYQCAFSTKEGINPASARVSRLARIPVGSDITGDLPFFRLKTSGVLGGAR
ncbi:MAG: polysaccharide deacetylase family protein [Thermodesulfobacteriota bacterium]